MESLSEQIVYPVNVVYHFKKADLLAVEPNDFMNGKCYFADNIPGLQFHVRIFPKRDDGKHSCIFVFVNGSADRNVNADLKMSIESRKTTTRRFNVVYGTYKGFGYSVDYADFFEQLFVNGILTVKIEGTLMVKKDFNKNIVSLPVSLKWRIKEKDLKLMKQSSGFLRSKRFLAFNKNAKYFLVLYYQETVKGRKVATLYLQIEFDYKATINVVMEYSLENGPRFIKEHLFERSHRSGISLCASDKLLSFITDGYLTIEFNSVFTKKIGSFPFFKKIRGLSTKSERQMSKKNFVIKAGSTQIRVNKNVLIKASPVWERMFENKWKESIENEMTINDFPPKIVKSAIQICNIGRSPYKLDLEDLFFIYKFGHMYQINLILNFAQKILIQKISSSTVCQLTRFSKSFDCPQLYQKCLDFMRNCCQKNLAIAGLQTLDKDLIQEIFFNLFTSVINTDTRL